MVGAVFGYLSVLWIAGVTLTDIGPHG